MIARDNITGVMQDVLPVRKAPSLQFMARVRQGKRSPRAEHRSGRSGRAEISMTCEPKLIRVD